MLLLLILAHIQPPLILLILMCRLSAAAVLASRSEGAGAFLLHHAKPSPVEWGLATSYPPLSTGAGSAWRGDPPIVLLICSSLLVLLAGLIYVKDFTLRPETPKMIEIIEEIIAVIVFFALPTRGLLLVSVQCYVCKLFELCTSKCNFHQHTVGFCDPGSS
jgi:hypothetical protein